MAAEDGATGLRDLIILGIISLACLVSLGIASGNLQESARSLGLGVAGQAQRLGSGLGSAVRNTTAAIRELATLRESYEAVLDRLQGYEQLQAEADRLRAENAELRRQSQVLSEDAIRNFVPARVIAKEPGPFFSSFTIDRGRNSGIEPGQPVVAVTDGRTGLAGRVVETSGGLALVEPVTAAGSHLAARLQQSRFDGLLSGTGSGLLVMDYVDRTVSVLARAGEPVITSGLNSRLPAGLLIGELDEIRVQPDQLSARLLVEPAVDFGRLELVLVLVPEAPDSPQEDDR